MRIRSVILLILLFVPGSGSGGQFADLAPLLKQHCLKCHGGAKQKGGLDLRSLESLLQGGDSGPVLLPGKP
ncbi:MAG: c-type cytochrome domain-containing protein, partial [Verrucomicrobiota bacterium]|nr:c-type cytochrome domain-containing protein [Verrucomicrobiota bacterium]